MTPKSAKEKGRRFQQWVAAKIGLLLDQPVGQDEQIASREMGQSGPDVRLVGEALSKFPFAVECKAQESWKPHEWIDQAKANVNPRVHKGGWLLFLKRRHRDPVVVMDAETFFEILGGKHGQHSNSQTPRSVSKIMGPNGAEFV